MARYLRMFRTAGPALIAVALFALVSTAVWAGGGSRVMVDTPDAASATLAPGADLVVRAYDCGEATDAAIEARADGLVNGARKTIALKLIKTSQTGVYGLARQWPATGRWVLSFTPKRAFAATTIVRVEPAGGAKSSVRMAATHLVDIKMAKKTIEAELRTRSS
jgi:hypothetical protein